MTGTSTLSTPLADLSLEVIGDLDVSTLLVTEPSPQHVRRWHAGWSEPGTPIHTVEQLVVLLAGLGDHDFAGVTTEASPSWAQTKRIGDRWVVEVHDGSEGWPSVVVPATGDDAIFASLSTPAGALWSHHAVAGVIWSWLSGHLPEGYALVEAPG